MEEQHIWLYIVLQFLGYLMQMIPVLWLLYAPYQQKYLRFSKWRLLFVLSTALSAVAAAGAIYLGSLYGQGGGTAVLSNRGSLIFSGCLMAGTLTYFLSFRRGVKGQLLLYMLVVQYGLLLYSFNRITVKFWEVSFLPTMHPYSLATLLTYLVTIGVSFPFFYHFLKHGHIQELLRMNRSGLRMITGCSFMILVLMVLSLQMESLLTLEGVSRRGNVYISIWMLCLMAADVLSYVIYFGCLILEKEKSEMKSQLSSYRQQYKWLNERIEKEKKRRHNLRHHLRTMDTLAQNGQVESLQEYIARYLEEVREVELQKLSGNPVVDEVMSYYVVQAREKQIDLSCSMKIRENLALNLADMTVLLGNAMENALYGCETCEEKARKIRVMIRQFRKNLLIKIENRIPSGEYESLGANVRKGYGLESIDMIARKYQGSMDAVREEDKFVLRVILNILGEEGM